jgi:type II secretory ATPase GspE/PulE/Tfp pilus assembly ATPase PilB-like protein
MSPTKGHRDPLIEFITQGALILLANLERELQGKLEGIQSTNEALYTLYKEVDPIKWIDESTEFLYTNREKIRRHLGQIDLSDFPYVPLPGTKIAPRILHPEERKWSKTKYPAGPLSAAPEQHSRELAWWVTYKTSLGKRHLLLISTFDPTHALQLRLDPKKWQATKEYWSKAGEEQQLIRTEKFNTIQTFTGIREWMDILFPQETPNESWVRQNVPHSERVEAGQLGLDLYHSNNIQCFAWSTHEKQKHKLKAKAELEQILSKKVSLFDNIYGTIQAQELSKPQRKSVIIETPEQEISLVAKEFWENTISTCYNIGASDIHLIPRITPDQSTHIEVKLRKNQNLHFHQNIPAALCKEYIRYALEHSGILQNQVSLSQDGRKSWKNPKTGKTVDLRISVTPLGHSLPMIVMRMLDTEKLKRGIDDLGLSPLELQIWKQILQLPQSLVLIGGRTNSGKSASIYSALLTIHKTNKHKAIATIEDPIEYRLPFGVQTPLDTAKGQTYSEVIQRFMRNDGNVIMVGEIRNAETAKAALELGLTGNQVLSTIHSNSTGETALRLYEWGMERYVVSEVIKLLCNQRLAGTPCPHCLERHTQAEIETLLFDNLGDSKAKDILENLLPKWAEENPENPQTLWTKNRGCTSCNYLGIGGMTAIQELLVIDQETKPLLKAAEIKKLSDAMRARGLYDMEKASWKAAWQGKIPVSEALTASRGTLL